MTLEPIDLNRLGGGTCLPTANQIRRELLITISSLNQHLEVQMSRDQFSGRVCTRLRQRSVGYCRSMCHV